MLYNLARRLTAGREEAEDIVQETYIRALQGWRRARPERMAPWLATICMNTVRSEYRRRAVRPAELLDPEPGATVAASDDTAAAALGAIDSDAVHRALQQLSAEQREAITLMDLCGFTASQAAELLAVPRNTVLARVHRGHKRLVVLLEGVIRRDA
jgi:RNA polymerase sigma-70 factor (ECF subfamily)